jgi:hypothetical protein
MWQIIIFHNGFKERRADDERVDWNYKVRNDRRDQNVKVAKHGTLPSQRKCFNSGAEI